MISKFKFKVSVILNRQIPNFGLFFRNHNKVLDTIHRHQPDVVYASSEYYKIMIESILATLDDKSSHTALTTRMTIAVDKLIELEVRAKY